MNSGECGIWKNINEINLKKRKNNEKIKNGGIKGLKMDEK